MKANVIPATLARRIGYDDVGFTNHNHVTNMPTAVKIKAGKYGTAIGLLLERGGSFQTRYERTLIVDGGQRRVLEEADLVETESLKAGKERGRKKDGKRAATRRDQSTTFCP